MVAGGPELARLFPHQLRLQIVQAETGKCLATAHAPPPNMLQPTHSNTHPALFFTTLRQGHCHFFAQRASLMQICT